MNAFRIVILAGALLTTAGAGYLSYHGIGNESTDLDRSIRMGSGIGGYSSNSRVK
ncbi:hypothetical protein GEU84_012920 [Fertoebacter nigrum]|uniref:Uncharacterized protein n=1 Tax=Fertoeibacter niger TaxID=2656921 RepID=A0A8X8GVT5_9RHOB|nr:hypothetical protein [Fertoeibacter niger]NUB45294.1 hypothetical protein [Fertoeibacter niger]